MRKFSHLKKREEEGRRERRDWRGLSTSHVWEGNKNILLESPFRICVKSQRNINNPGLFQSIETFNMMSNK